MSDHVRVLQSLLDCASDFGFGYRTTDAIQAAIAALTPQPVTPAASKLERALQSAYDHGVNRAPFPMVDCLRQLSKPVTPAGGEVAPANVVDRMVASFLTWQLPVDVCADLCATVHGQAGRSGTNLLTATQAKLMVEHLYAAALAGRDRYATAEEGDAFTDGYLCGEREAHPPAADAALDLLRRVFEPGVVRAILNLNHGALVAEVDAALNQRGGGCG